MEQEIANTGISDHTLIAVITMIYALLEIIKWLIKRITMTSEVREKNEVRQAFWKMEERIKDLHDEHKLKQIKKAVAGGKQQGTNDSM